MIIIFPMLLAIFIFIFILLFYILTTYLLIMLGLYFSAFRSISIISSPFELFFCFVLRITPKTLHNYVRYIKAPKDTSGEEKQAEQALQKKHKTEEDAFGTYASQGGEKFVYRVKKEGGFGGYKVRVHQYAI